MKFCEGWCVLGSDFLEGKIKGLTAGRGFYQLFQCSKQRYGDETWYHFNVNSYTHGNTRFQKPNDTKSQPKRSKNQHRARLTLTVRAPLFRRSNQLRNRLNHVQKLSIILQNAISNSIHAT